MSDDDDDDDDDVDVAVLLAVPSMGPVVEVNGKAGRNQVELVWNEIAPSDRRGFITNYTIYYTNGNNVLSKCPSEVFTAYSPLCSRSIGVSDPVLTLRVNAADVTVPGNVTSHTLESLLADTKYDTWVKVSTIKGSKIGITHSFITQKYGKYICVFVVVIVPRNQSSRQTVEMVPVAM